MNNASNIDFDASRFYDFVANMDKKTMNRAERDALRRSVGITARATRRNLRARWPKSASTKGGGKPALGLVANVQKATTGDLYGQVHIMGSARTDRGFLLRFFEKGTDERFAKVRTRAFRGRSVEELRASNAGWRNRIKPKWFFRDAVASTKQQVFSEMEDQMQNAVLRQWVKSAQKGGAR